MITHRLQSGTAAGGVYRSGALSSSEITPGGQVVAPGGFLRIDRAGLADELLDLLGNTRGARPRSMDMGQIIHLRITPTGRPITAITPRPLDDPKIVDARRRIRRRRDAEGSGVFGWAALAAAFWLTVAAWWWQPWW